MTYRMVPIKDMDEWAEFVYANKEALIEEYDSVEDALQHALQGGLILGGSHFYFED